VLAIFWVIGVEKTSHVADHLHAQSAVEVGLSLIEGTHPDSNLNTHQLSEYKANGSILINKWQSDGWEASASRQRVSRKIINEDQSLGNVGIFVA
jgi:hypothetical protein